MGVELSRQEIEEKLIRGREVDWDFLRQLYTEDRESYESAKYILNVNGIITSNAEGNYFIFSHIGQHIDPRVTGLRYVYYFKNRNHAEEFKKRFHPDGLVARVEG